MAGKFEKPRSREDRNPAAAPMERRPTPSRTAPARPAQEQRQAPNRPAPERRQAQPQNSPRSRGENNLPTRRPRRQRRRKSVLPIAAVTGVLLLALVVCLSVFGKEKATDRKSVV